MKLQPSILVIFGATGDLVRKKLMPALFNLFKEKLLPEKFAILGFSRRGYTDSDFVEYVKEGLKRELKENFDEKTWSSFAKLLFYQSSQFSDLDGYLNLRKRIMEIDEEFGTCGNKTSLLLRNKLFYLATPPNNYSDILGNLEASKLYLSCDPKQGGWTRILVEKPFGRDLESAKKLDSQFGKIFTEEQIYRIDHFLGKETVQNILAFRFGNEIFERLWNKDFVDHIQITVAESEGVFERGPFYEQVGALRDVGQNHLLQLLTVTCMEQPVSFKEQFVRKERENFLKSLIKFDDREINFVVRGQYDKGVVDGKEVLPYRREEGIASNSYTETFVALKLFSKNKRWEGVPFYIRTGKRLKRRIAEISVVFKKAPKKIFERGSDEINVLSFRIQPDEGISLTLVAKEPGHGMVIKPVTMEFCYHNSFNSRPIDAYERLLVDAFTGDRTLFPSITEILASWDFIDPILKNWERLEKPKFPIYESGQWGPKESSELIEKDGRKWYASESMVCSRVKFG